MKLTPIDIHHKEFKRKVRGYSEEDVDVFLDNVSEEFERLYKENNNLKEEVSKHKAKVDQYENMQQTLQNTLLTAQKSAEEVQLNAKKEADSVLRDAKKEAQKLLEDARNQQRYLTRALEGLQAIEGDFRASFKATIESFSKKVDGLVREESALSEKIAEEMEKLPSLEDTATSNPVDVQEAKKSVEEVSNSANDDSKKKTQTKSSSKKKSQQNPKPKKISDELKDELVEIEQGVVTDVSVDEIVVEDNSSLIENTDSKLIATEAEIDKFLEADQPQANNEFTDDSKSGFFSRLRSPFKGRKEEASLKKKPKAVTAAKNQQKPQPKKKKKAKTKKKTQEIEV